jgi:hypothetical protein
MTGMYKGYVNSIVPDIREKTSSSMKKNLARLTGTEFVHLRADLESDVHVYICMYVLHS